MLFSDLKIKNNYRRSVKISFHLKSLEKTICSKRNLPTFAALYAGVVKLVDTLDLGSSALRYGGSSPSARTLKQQAAGVSIGCFFNFKRKNKMATVNRENIGTLHDKLSVKITKEDYWPGFEKSLKQNAKKVNVPGFRKGMVPAALIRKMYGQSVFNDEVIRIAGKELEDYLKKEKLDIFAQPMIISDQRLNMDMNQAADMEFEFEIGLKPTFDIPSIKNKASLTRYKVKVSDEIVENEIGRTRLRFGTREELNTITANDEIVTLNVETCDENGTVTDGTEIKEVVVRIDRFPENLQKLLMNKTLNESVFVRPCDVAEGEGLHTLIHDLKAHHGDENSNFKLTISKVAMMRPAEMDASLFMQVFPNADITSTEVFTAKMREELEREYDNLGTRRLHDEIFEMLVHSTPVELPINFLKRWMKDGMEKPKSIEEVEKEYPAMEHQIRWELISGKLMQENNIQVSYDEVMLDIKKNVLGYFGMSADDDAPWMDTYLQKMAKDEKTIDQTYRNILTARLFDFLATQFSLVEKEVTEEEFFKLPQSHDAHHH